MVLGLITGPGIIVLICFLQVGANYRDHWSVLGGAAHHHQPLTSQGCGAD